MIRLNGPPQRQEEMTENKGLLISSHKRGLELGLVFHPLESCLLPSLDERTEQTMRRRVSHALLSFAGGGDCIAQRKRSLFSPSGPGLNLNTPEILQVIFQAECSEKPLELRTRYMNPKKNLLQCQVRSQDKSKNIGMNNSSYTENWSIFSLRRFW